MKGKPFKSESPIAVAVWSRVLHGMWKTGSALPLERGVMVQNAKGDFVAANPVTAIDFPFSKEALPNSFSSPAWGALQDPTYNSEHLVSICPTFIGEDFSKVRKNPGTSFVSDAGLMLTRSR